MSTKAEQPNTDSFHLAAPLAGAPCGDKAAVRGEIIAAPMSAYSPEDQAFYRFWYGHMLHDLMQPPLSNIDHATARYIWDAAISAAFVARIVDEIDEMLIARQA